ncbi:hypothetical protein LTR56_020093 [Elasticomyces elasticus]|nr:hypothetical protein LTR56_020093 [Elasticomyces elasticus]KAK3633856.1 hypothetical protein LTR22_019931 [Elasticomyces elasticus]KAK4910964.1 hypothetical protein LTR49_020409 [Elasticomyces elasticus]
METTTRPTVGGHKRNASSKSNLLRAFVSSSKPNPRPETNNNINNMQRSSKSVPFLPPDHPHAVAVKARVLGERQGNVQSPPTSPVKQNRGIKSGNTTTTQQIKVKTTDGATNSSPKKSKSSTNLSAMFGRMNRSSKDLTALNTTTNTNTGDKENTTPPPSSGRPQTAKDTPIWAQFAAKPASRPGTRDSKSSANNISDEIARYTPREYSPSKQRNFDGEIGRGGEMARPTLNSRPKSMYVSSSTTEGWAGALGRKVSGQRASIEGRMSGDGRRESGGEGRRASGERPGLIKRSLTERKASGGSAELAPEKAKERGGLSVLKRGGRVMAAVAAFQGKSKPATPTESQDSSLDPKALDEAFEAVLQSRQIPEPMRQKMRSLTLRVKADFIKQDLGSKTTTSNSPEGSVSAGVAEGLRSPGKRDSPEDRRGRDDEEKEKATKRSRSRPRSRTFTFSKGDKRGGDAAPAKERSKSKSRPTSVYIPADNTSTTTSKSPFGSLGRKAATTAVPADYINHLRSQTDPTKLEVGRLHKLRILLRNETVAWVDSFLSLGGMTEIVGLLHSIMALEWREEHEDQLFHETLLCLKGVCTTELAMLELAKVADELFPALLGCLFDEEKKGPAEYATRTVIVNVLFNFLDSATSGSPEALEERARRILGYLGEPQKAEEERPVGFVLEMRVPRPYRLWAREVTNVTREVFWIFLHHLNVVASPKRYNDNETDEDRAKVLEATYTQRHFPGSRPPVPAAPYIGGVEWDATTYITAHLDLLNGLLASLPSAEARNGLREEMRASGWEKTMGCTLRTCKEKFYSGVHDGLRVWVAAAGEDVWGTGMVREGPSDEERAEGYRARSKSPKKKEGAPKIEALPQLDLGLGGGEKGEERGWLE